MWGFLELVLPLEDFVGAAADDLGVDLRIGRALAAEEHHLTRFVQPQLASKLGILGRLQEHTEASGSRGRASRHGPVFANVP